MNSSSFLTADGTLPPTRNRWWSAWLPTFRQVQQAVQPRFGSGLGTETAADTEAWTISMRQGLGLVVVAALIAGLLPFLLNAINAMRLGTVLPFAQAVQTPGMGVLQAEIWGDTWGRLAGLPPAWLPGWLAGLLTSLGAWINVPLNWLTWWLVYGTAVLAVTKIWAAPTTLQHFLAATSYAAVPLILTGLGPIPCLGALAQIVAVVWMLAVYAQGVRATTGFDWGHTVVAILAPGAIIALLGLVLLLATAITALSIAF